MLPNAPHGLAEAVSSGGSRAAAAFAPPGQRADVVHAAKVAFVSGFNEILLIGAILSFVAAALGFALVRAARLRRKLSRAPKPRSPSLA